MKFGIVKLYCGDYLPAGIIEISNYSEALQHCAHYFMAGWRMVLGRKQHIFKHFE